MGYFVSIDDSDSPCGRNDESVERHEMETGRFRVSEFLGRHDWEMGLCPGASDFIGMQHPITDCCRVFGGNILENEGALVGISAIEA